MSKDKKDNNKGRTDQEINNRLKLYIKLSKSTREAFKYVKIEKEIEDKKQKDNQDRNTAATYYSMGAKSGLPQNSYEQIKYQNEQQDQKYLDQKAEEAKEIYNKGDNLSKEFNNDKDKSDDRER